MLKQSLFAGFVLLVQAGATLHAHDLPVSELKLVAGDDRLHLEIMLNAWELQFFNELDGDKNNVLDRKELEGREEQIARQVLDNLDILVDGRPIRADVAGLIPDYNTHHLSVRAHYLVDARVAKVEVASRLAAITNAAHIVKLTLQRPGGTERASLSSSDSIAQFPALVQERSVASTVSPKPSGNDDVVQSRLLRRIGIGLVLAFAAGSVIFLFARSS